MTNPPRVDESADTLTLRQPSIASSDDETIEVRSLTPRELEELLRSEDVG
jgi:hypothetical protein